MQEGGYRECADAAQKGRAPPTRYIMQTVWGQAPVTSLT